MVTRVGRGGRGREPKELGGSKAWPAGHSWTVGVVAASTETLWLTWVSQHTGSRGLALR